MKYIDFFGQVAALIVLMFILGGILLIVCKHGFNSGYGPQVDTSAPNRGIPGVP